MGDQKEGHTVQRYDGELNHLHYRVLEMGGLVLNQLNQALQAFRDKNLNLAHKVIQGDQEVDRLEVALDDEVFKLLARRCPLGSDLRLVMGISKIVTDLERMGDKAVKVANLTLHIYDNEGSDPSSQLLRDVNRMGKMAGAILQQALDVFDTLDVERAKAIVYGPKELDEEFNAGLRRLITFVLEDARNIGYAINLVMLIKALERIEDHSRNIAEYVIFQVKGEDIRHQQSGDQGNSAAP